MNLDKFHVAVILFLAIVSTLVFRQWAIVFVPLLVTCYFLTVYRTCPARTEIIFICLFVTLLASYYKALPLLIVQDFHSGSESFPLSSDVTETTDQRQAPQDLPVWE